MFKSSIARVLTFVMALVLALSMAACGSKNQPADAEKPGVEKLSGTIQIAGSTSVQPLSEELAKAFMSKNPKVRINVAGGGSGAGVKGAQQGTADIGAASRELKAEEEDTVKNFTIALDGIAIVVNPGNKVSDLTKEDIKKIYTGEITDWSQLGGDSGKITVYVREDGSGTRGAFDELVLGEDVKPVGTAVVQNSTGAVRTAVQGDKNGIGYISMGSMNDEVKALKVDGAEATIDSVKSSTYKIARPFNYMTQKDTEGAVKAYIDWVFGEEGQKIVEETGFISVK